MSTSFSRWRMLLLAQALWLVWAAVALGVGSPVRGRVLTVAMGAPGLPGLEAAQPLRSRDLLLLSDSSAPGTITMRSDAQGRISLPDALPGEMVRALYLLREQPSSRRPGGWATRTYARGATTGSQLTLDPAATLTLFNVTVSLEWQ